VQHPPFKNPPIIEAVVALKFLGGTDWSEEQRAAIREGLRVVYDGPERQEVQFRVQTKIEGDDATTTTTAAPRRVLLSTADGTGLVGVGDGVLSIHVLRPYPGWKTFEGRVRFAADVVTAVTGARVLQEVALRYIDRIALPTSALLPLERYFTVIPRRPDGMPGSLAAFQCITEAHDAESNAVAVLTTTAVPPNPGESFAMLYDLNLFRVFPKERPLEVEQYSGVLNALHRRQYEIFMDSITDDTKELFQ